MTGESSRGIAVAGAWATRLPAAGSPRSVDGGADVAASASLTPLQLLRRVCDTGSLELIRTAARTRGLEGTPGDGVLGGAGEIDGRPVLCFAQDQAVLGGSLGQTHAETIVRILDLAERAGAPVIACAASAGARLQEGTVSLDAYGEVFRRQVALGGRVPQITYVRGVAAGGGAYSPALSDFVIMREDASMFLTGPRVLREVMGERVDPQTLGGAAVHARNGVSHFRAADDAAAAHIVRELVGYLPGRAGERAARAPALPGGPGRLEEIVPRDGFRVYDVRDVIRRLADGGHLLEFAPDWATNMVCAFARLEGDPVGFVANQPRRLGGAIDAAASEKAARFVARCDSFGLPLVVLVDTPGFLPGRRQEAVGVIRQGAELVRAFAAAAVPRITVVLRKAFGGGYIAMNSKALGAALVFAWDRAELGVMGARPAVRIINRRELAGASEPDAALAQLSESYAEQHLGAEVAAKAGVVDELIAPEQTRGRLIWALRTLMR
jgi:acetyl-CoA carboxylase carboxyltransferase component